jgi:hypothetical protein
MRLALALLATLVLAACNPIPIKRACEMPEFILPDTADVHKRFDTWGYFERYCHEPAPEQFTVIGSERIVTLTVTVDGEWIRLAAHSKDQGPIRLRGTTHRGTEVRHDQLHGSPLIIEAVDSDGRTHEQFLLHYRPLSCTCVTFDAV